LLTAFALEGTVLKPSDGIRHFFIVPRQQKLLAWFKKLALPNKFRDPKSSESLWYNGKDFTTIV
jgi:hypothetical protein